MSAPLPNDITRCHDSLCPLRDTCRRWLCRNDDGRLTHTGTMRGERGAVCGHYMAAAPAYCNGLSPQGRVCHERHDCERYAGPIGDPLLPDGDRTCQDWRAIVRADESASDHAEPEADDE